MNTALFVITHKDIAHTLLEVANNIVNDNISNYSHVEVPMDANIGTIVKLSENRIDKLDTSDGLLILTDVFGGTPANIATKLSKTYGAKLVSGVNLPMLLKIMTHRDLSINELTNAALDGGIHGIKKI